MKEVAAIREYLLAGRNPDGGWGYARGKGSRLEPTCCAVMALGDPQIARAALAGWPARDGLLLERAGGDPNYGFHALALLALDAARVEHGAGNAPLVNALQRAHGQPVAASTVNRQNNSIQGWSWIADTFSWAEPTAWGLLALKRARAAGGSGVETTRITECEALLLDRVCGVGGWNYGTSNVLGRELRGYVPTTAIVLLALQDQRNIAAVQRSVAFLQEHATWECSSYALGLAAIALRVYGCDVTAALEALERQIPVTCDLDQQLGVALALLAFEEENAAAAFRL